MYPRKTEASCDISKHKKDYFPQKASAKKIHFGMAKINIGFKFSGGVLVQNNLMRTSFCGCVKNKSRVLVRLDVFLEQYDNTTVKNEEPRA